MEKGIGKLIKVGMGSDEEIERFQTSKSKVVTMKIERTR